MSIAVSSKSGRVDILLATYNGSSYIGELIDSIQAQGYQNWRLIISDDGSTDDTLEIVRKRAQGDCRIIEPVHHRSTGYPKDNFFFLLSLVDSSAEYVAFCDQDDIWLPNKLQMLVDGVQEDVPMLAFSDLTVIDSAGNLVEKSFMELPSFDPYKLGISTLMVQNSVPGCSMLMNRRLYDLIVIPSVTRLVVMHDWWTMLVAATFGHIRYIKEPLIKYRRHATNASGDLTVNLFKGLASIFEVFDSHTRAQAQSLQFYCTYRDLIDGREEGALLRSYGLLLSQSRLARIRIVNKNHLWRIAGVLAACAQLAYLIFEKKQSVGTLFSACAVD